MRKVFSLLLAALLLLSFSIPCFAEELPAPMEKIISPGVTNVNYAGQNFRFNTTVYIQVSFIPRDFNLIELKFISHSATTTRTPAMAVSPAAQISIDWVTWNTTIFSGSPPPEGWTGLLNTESGYTEK